MNNFCIVAQGGGMVTAYHAGVIRALKERFGFDGLNRIIASSGAAVTYSYLVSGQGDLIQPIWENLVRSGKFVTPWKLPIGKNVMDIDFLIDEMIKKKYSLDLGALQRSPIELDIGITDAETAKSLFYSNKDDINFHELLRASCSVPYFSRDKVLINGRYYYDGTIGSVSGLDQALDEQNIILVLTRPALPLCKAYFLRKILRWLLIRQQTLALQKAIWSMVKRYEQIPLIIKELKNRKNIAVIQPSSNLPILRIDTRLERLKQTIKQGYDDTMSHTQLESFFEKIN